MYLMLSVSFEVGMSAAGLRNFMEGELQLLYKWFLFDLSAAKPEADFVPAVQLHGLVLSGCYI